MRTHEQSIRAERKTERSGPKSQMGEAERELEKNEQSGRSHNGSGAVSGLNLPLMSLKPVVLCICTLIFLEAKRGPGPGTNRLDFGGNPMTFHSLPPFSPHDQSWPLCNICVYTIQ